MSTSSSRISSQARTWSRSCDVAVTVYRLLADWPDRAFAERVLANAFVIPERVAAGLAARGAASRRRCIDASAEALAILQTQIYLACECGLLERDLSNRICSEASELTEQLAVLGNADVETQ